MYVFSNECNTNRIYDGFGMKKKEIKVTFYYFHFQMCILCALRDYHKLFSELYTTIISIETVFSLLLTIRSERYLSYI